MKRLMIIFIVLLLTLVSALPSAAQAPLPVPPIWLPLPRPTPQPTPVSVELAGYDVQVTVKDQVALYEVALLLANPGPREAEADLVMPLPGQAAVTALALWIDGRKIEAQLLPADEALATYTEIVRQRLDPALLEYAGQGAVRARVFPVPAHGQTRVRLTFTQVLTAEAGLIALDYPLGASLPTAPELRLTFTAQLQAAQGIGAVYSPTHDIAVQRQGSDAIVTLRGATMTDMRPLVIYYGAQQGDIGASALSYRTPGEDGHFMLLLTPPAVTKTTKPVSRDVIIVLDTSGSMRGEKLEQARQAATYVLQNLNPGDRFGLLSFGSGVNPFATKLQELEVVPAAQRYLETLHAEGGTNIDGALAAALDLTATGRPQVLLFLTDGLPTVGEVKVETILANLAASAGPDVQLFSFGVGDDVNTLLLDRAALDHHGTVSYVRPGEDIEQRVSSLYDKISLPVLSNVALRFQGVETYDLYPTPLPDLFAGEQLVVAGRYRQGGALTVTLSGMREGRTQQQELKGLTLVTDGGESFVPAVWAARKVGYLLAAIKLHGEQPELVDEVIILAERYGILTPYTSFLADELEDAPILTAPMLSGPLSRGGRLQGTPTPTALGGYGKTALSASGAGAVEQSVAEQALRDSERPATAATRRLVGDKTFVLTDGVWVDTLYNVKLPSETVIIGSARYLELLRAHPDWGQWLALGLRVTLVYEGRVYQFVE